jgi:hypothetical protein
MSLHVLHRAVNVYVIVLVTVDVIAIFGTERHLSPLSSAIIDNSEVLPHPGSDCTTTVSSSPTSGMNPAQLID